LAVSKPVQEFDEVYLKSPGFGRIKRAQPPVPGPQLDDRVIEFALQDVEIEPFEHIARSVGLRSGVVEKTILRSGKRV